MDVPILTFNQTEPGTHPYLDTLIASRMLIQANSGGGKSRALRSLLEGTHGRVQQFVLDPEGEFSSLREKFDYVLAGKDGDVPCHPSSARVLCRKLMELNASAVLDLYDLSLDDRKLFVRLFLEELMSLPKTMWRPLLVVIDEAHLFCPEVGKVESSEAVKSLIALGRKRGFCAVVATQRIQKFHKDAAAELLNKLIGRTGLDVDVKRAADELGFNKEQAATLKRLEPGQFYVYGPAISNEVALVRTGEVVTSHPEAGKLIEYSKAPARGALREILKGLGDIPAQAAEQAQTVEELQEQLAMFRMAANSASANRKIEVVEKIVEKRVEVPVPIMREGEIERLEEVGHAVIGAAKDLHGIGADILATVRGFAAPSDAAPELNALQSDQSSTRLQEPAKEPEAAPIAPQSPIAAPRIAKRPNTPTRTKAAISGPQQRVLDALAGFAALGIENVARSNVAVWSKQSPRSSGFEKNVSTLRTLGLLDYPSGGLLTLTNAGRDVAQRHAQFTTLAQLHQAWFAHISNPQARILRALIVSHPTPQTRADVAVYSEQSINSSGFEKNVSTLRSLGLLDYPQRGLLQATALLFPKGLK